MTNDVSDATWEREALRLYRRYELEVVEACGLCPWAEQARLTGRVHPRVVLGSGEAARLRAMALMRELATDARVEVALLIFPRIDLGRSAFDGFVARLRDANASSYEVGTVPFVMAGFHPDATADLADPERLIPFLRRTPDPTIQLLRSAVLDRIRGKTPQGTQFVDLDVLETLKFKTDAVPLRARIARTNFETVQRMGLAELERRLGDIRRDRDVTYGTLRG